MWEGKYKEEVTKTEPLEEVCGELRDELDMAHKQRLDAFEIKMKPIVVREGPSRKVNKSNMFVCSQICIKQRQRLLEKAPFLLTILIKTVVLQPLDRKEYNWVVFARISFPKYYVTLNA